MSETIELNQLLKLETRLEMAQRHVSEGRTLVERHRAFIAKLRAAGRPTQ